MATCLCKERHRHIDCFLRCGVKPQDHAKCLCLVSRQLYTVHCTLSQCTGLGCQLQHLTRTGRGAINTELVGGYFSDRKLSGVSGMATTEENHFRSLAGLTPLSSGT